MKMLFNQFIINEILYDVPDVVGDYWNYQFIELYNNGNDSIDLNEWNISSQNIDFSFEEYILEPGEYILLARNVISTNSAMSGARVS